MTKERIVYWHDQMERLLQDLGVSPEDRAQRILWCEVLESVGNLRVALRRLHGDWKSVEQGKKESLKT